MTDERSGTSFSSSWTNRSSSAGAAYESTFGTGFDIFNDVLMAHPFGSWLIAEIRLNLYAR
jgi:hypothetical protein